jgi:hypothetical protein
MLFPLPFKISISLNIPTISSAPYVFRGIFHHSFVLFYHDFSLLTIGFVFGGQVNIRELENLNRIPAEQGGDLYLINGAMTKLQDAGIFADTFNNKEEPDGKTQKQARAPR